MARDTFLELVTWSRRFREAKLPFMFVGAYAAAVHGLPRSTNDVDVVVHVGFEERERVADMMRRRGKVGLGAHARSLLHFGEPRA